MFDFKKKKVNPLVRAALSEIDFAFKMEAPDKKVEKLLSVDEMVQSEFGKATKSQAQANSTYLGLAGLGFGLIFVGTIASGGLALAGVILALGSFATSLKFAANQDLLKRDENTLREVIGTEIARVAEESPAEAIKSPRFVRSIAAAFKNVAQDKLSGKPETLRARVAFTPAAPAA